ncbi:hypothetical protein [Croceimicrobium hydrocarbonivorans]|uniref:Uncharacterized protein n=1 Tax=Croceimicrobium hydrocarbonivorans TaxID=2761580 RepID=A0A7H0VGN2_9FLAO|nr:hypothetical protein [Croceimicrobium hydrocarbonivorans]QNR24880.1 hypothetical protein H4K34_03295 [Croceimicrobium hydrocarbonivorans]
MPYLPCAIRFGPYKMRLHISILLFPLLCACGRTNRIPNNDLDILPYNGNEILIFESNLAETDTIFLQGSNRFIRPTDPLDLFPIKAEHYFILNKHSDPNPPSGKHRYLDGHRLVGLAMNESNETYIEIDFAAKDAWFYGESKSTLKKFKELPEKTLLISGRHFTDVVIIEDQKKKYFERTNHIERLYWSRSQGIIRYDKKHDEVWELKEKYTPQQRR